MEISVSKSVLAAARRMDTLGDVCVGVQHWTARALLGSIASVGSAMQGGKAY